MIKKIELLNNSKDVAIESNEGAPEVKFNYEVVAYIILTNKIIIQYQGLTNYKSHTVRFIDEKDKLAAFADRMIVMLCTLNISKNAEKNRNIYCLNEKAEILWQIQDPDTYRPGKPQSDSPFTGIWISEDGRLKAYNWNSHDYDVDIETGRLLYAEWTK